MAARLFSRILLAAAVAWAGAAPSGLGKPVAPHTTSEPAATSTGPATADTHDEPLGEPKFNNAPRPLPPNLPSVGFEATRTSEFGDLVRLAGPAHFINGVTVALSSHALHSDFPRLSPLGFSHPITLKLYRVDRRGGAPAPGALIAASTQTFLVPWRPEPDASVASPLRPWRAEDGRHYTGLAFNVTFDLSARALELPAEIIVAVAFDTQSAGAKPLRVAGPYNHLHVALTDLAPTSGADPDPDAVFWQTAIAANYSDAGPAGGSVLRRDPGWAAHQPAIRINDSAYGMIASAASTLHHLPTEDLPAIAALVESSELLGSALDRTLWHGNDRLRPLWGRLVFELIAEAADALSPLATADGPLAPPVRAALDALLTAGDALVETAVGDAIIGGGNAQRISRAQAEFEAATALDRADHIDRTLGQLADAWREAGLSLR